VAGIKTLIQVFRNKQKLAGNKTKKLVAKFSVKLKIWIEIKSMYIHYVNMSIHGMCIRFARWFVFKPKIPIWVNFEGP
jgi:hypothetical protein